MQAAVSLFRGYKFNQKEKYIKNLFLILDRVIALMTAACKVGNFRTQHCVLFTKTYGSISIVISS